MAKRRWVVVGMALVAGAAVFALWPRGPRLEWYTSRAVTDRHGNTFRLGSLVPVGWEIVEEPLITVHGPLYFIMQPSKSVSWPAIWLTRLLRIQTEDAYIRLAAGAREEPAWNVIVNPSSRIEDTSVEEQFWSGRKSYSAYAEKLHGSVTYCRQNKDEFNATYRQICDGFRVIREK